MKKIFSTIVLCSLVGLSAFGCAPNENDNNRSSTYYRGYSNPYAFDYTRNYNAYGNNADYLGYTRTNEIDYSDNILRNDNAKNNMQNKAKSNKTTKNNNYRYNIMNNGGVDNGNTGLNTNGYTTKENSIKSLCNKQTGVKDTSVAVNGNTCYVGLDMNNTKNLSEKMKEQLSTSIKRIDPSITKVYFTTEDNAVNKLMNTVRNRANTDWNEIENLFR